MGRKSRKPARGRPITMLLSLPVELGYCRARAAAAAAAWLWWRRTVSLSSRSLLLRCSIAAINEMYKRPAFLAKRPAFSWLRCFRRSSETTELHFFQDKKKCKFPHDRMTYIHCNCRVIVVGRKSRKPARGRPILCYCHCQWSWAIAGRGRRRQQQHGCGGCQWVAAAGWGRWI